MTQVNEIQKLASENETAKSILTHFAGRERFRRETDMNRFQSVLLRSGQKVVEKDYLETFKRFESLGLGVIVYGRGSNPSRFIWNYDLKTVGKAAVGQQEAVQELPKALKTVRTAKRRPGRPKGSKNKALSKAEVIKTLEKLLESLK